MRRAATVVLAGLALVFIAAGATTGDDRPTMRWPAGIGGPKRTGGAVPPALRDPVVTRDFGLTWEDPCSREAHRRSMRFLLGECPLGAFEEDAASVTRPPRR